MTGVGQCLKLAKLVFHIVDKTLGTRLGLQFVKEEALQCRNSKNFENKNTMGEEIRSVIVPKYTVENKKGQPEFKILKQPAWQNLRKLVQDFGFEGIW